MCGIVGGVNIKWKSDPLKTIEHRGPDSKSFFKNNKIYLGHSRLSIIDTSDNANQPMISNDKNWIIIFNGEIYNHKDIREELVKKYNTSFISTSDTETLLKGWIIYKEDILKKLNGIFSFAIFEKDKNKLTLVRDPFGVKPLYIYRYKNNFAFSSELKSFLQIEEFNNQINLKGIINHCTFLWNPGSETMYKNVKKILPGYLLQYDLISDRFVQKKYFIESKIQLKNNFSENQWIDKLDHLLNKAVKRQLMSDVPIGFFLSGGIDSSLIVAIAKKLNPNKEINCFTIKTSTSKGIEGFEDDLPYARMVANHLGVKLHEVPINNEIFKKDIDKMIYYLDEPQADIAPLNVQVICKKAKSLGIKVLIGGVGGDDLFSGYRRHRAIILENKIKFIPNFILKFFKNLLKIFPSRIPFFRRLKKLTRDWDKNPNERLFGFFNWLPNDKFIEELVNKKLMNIDPYEYFKDIIKSEDHKSLLYKMLLLEQKTFLIDHNLNYTDKMSMVEGIEARVPFLDIDLVNFSKQIPDHYKVRNGQTKYILKKVSEKYLPINLIYRSKTGFGAPVRDIIKNDLDRIKKKYFDKNKIESQGIFNYSTIEKMINDYKSGKEDYGYNLLSLMSIQIWLNKFIKY